MTLCPRVVELLRQQGMGDVLVLVGGIIPEADQTALKVAGIRAIFGPGTPTQEIADFIQREVAMPTEA
jgi:methylmalonyl-CoA mutase C-terminal domain/subunit